MYECVHLTDGGHLEPLCQHDYTVLIMDILGQTLRRLYLVKCAPITCMNSSSLSSVSSSTGLPLTACGELAFHSNRTLEIALRQFMLFVRPSYNCDSLLPGSAEAIVTFARSLM